MFQRDGNSEFVDKLIFGKRGNLIGLKKAQENGVETKEDATNLLKKFDKSEDIPNSYVKEHNDRIESGDSPKEVITDFFEGLNKVKKDANKMTLRTAHLLRQAGVFNRADKDVYQDLKTSDFWKISDDKKHVMRVFKEVEGGISDR
jgi:hypothetical protein